MCDFWTLVISLFGLVSAFIYLFRFAFRKSDIAEECHFDRKQKDIDILLKDYEITNIEIQRRSHITLLVGSILVAASFFIIGQTIFESNGIDIHLAALASVGLYFVWLFFLHTTTKLLDSKAYARIRGIENKFTEIVAFRSGNQYFAQLNPQNQIYEFGIHTYLNERSKEGWLQVRRGFWGWTYILLCICWIYISGYLHHALIYASILFVIAVFLCLR